VGFAYWRARPLDARRKSAAFRAEEQAANCI
jgi:hypothetical protein